MKKKSSFITITLLLVLCVLAVFVFRKKGGKGNIDQDSQRFKFEDTAKITRLFLIDKEGKKVTLTRKGKDWLVNDKYIVRKDAILTLLETIKKVEVKSHVPNSLKPGVLKLMSAKAVKIEVYAGDDLVRQYYVGHESGDHEGTHMILTNLETGENYPEPYITHIPGFIGFLTTRYFTDESDWRDRLAINYKPNEIANLKMEHLENPDSSFAIIVQNMNNIILQNSKGVSVAYDGGKMKQYLSYFQNISYETLFTTSAAQLADSLARNANPYIRFTITDPSGISKTYSLYHRSPEPGRANQMGEVYKYDPERCFMRFSKDNEWALIQFYVFGKLIPTIRYFAPVSTVKK
jgi:hypothetical protein